MNRAEKGAKYVNSPETAIFKKSKVLFAFDKARKSIVDLRQVVLVEGQIDAMRAHQVGLTHVVASQGTALTEEHARLIKRYADEVILVFDADAAGAKAAQSSAEIFIAQELAVRVATLPEKEDPDSLIRSQGVEAMQSLLDEAVDALEFLVRTLSADPASKGEVGRMRTTRAVLDLIRKTPSATTQDDMLARASALLGVGKDVLVAELKRGAIKPVERKKTVEKEESRLKCRSRPMCGQKKRSICLKSVSIITKKCSLFFSNISPPLFLKIRYVGPCLRRSWSNCLKSYNAISMRMRCLCSGS